MTWSSAFLSNRQIVKQRNVSCWADVELCGDSSSYWYRPQMSQLLMAEEDGFTVQVLANHFIIGPRGVVESVWSCPDGLVLLIWPESRQCESALGVSHLLMPPSCHGEMVVSPPAPAVVVIFVYRWSPTTICVTGLIWPPWDPVLLSLLYMKQHIWVLIGRWSPAVTLCSQHYSLIEQVMEYAAEWFDYLDLITDSPEKLPILTRASLKKRFLNWEFPC